MASPPFAPLSLPRPPTPSLPTTEDATVESGLLPEQQQQQQQRQRAWANIRPRAAEDQDDLPPDLEGQEPEAASMKISDQDVDGYKEQDRFLPIANVARVMKRVLPSSTKVSKESKEIVQECTSEFISFITSEAAERCSAEKRKTINGEDLLFAMNSLGFENYAEVMKIYLSKWRALGTKEGKRGKRKNSTTGDLSNQNGNGDVIKGRKRRNKKARTEEDESESTSRSEDQLDGDQGDAADEEEEDDDEDQDEYEGDEDGRRVYGL
ncbi:hypothetical protein MVLG_03545 [Microbotryum lychnidis-dioicae p1A1 Lamole]|uniref:Transcription factor CBF/NF-Y/archaeal histone domain-containing protein n=1 Tax=Microbotryum lychnidis-dioicae (strain p1A1 Lamole / MvSl-1064) TaxID=683840 RepID=U5H8I7_USTV1|nr:hypothetical protein MVLG_03545 [Microbotryum lychnidis-dioicae p1A1 Lamole]|eukprot:KDE06129.1 hypothetical protein MVLG_03545 [Microbotryum lychnidis-dioicae p1A1 Lamole]